MQRHQRKRSAIRLFAANTAESVALIIEKKKARVSEGKTNIFTSNEVLKVTISFRLIKKNPVFQHLVTIEQKVRYMQES